ncbi:MAG: hypothetical protein OEN55_15560 [Alphaproteobacteria bacterium]|nr:hypothetical protein [Alphaproteobacteria bacterium]
MSGHAPIPFRSRHGAMMRMGAVERMIAAYFAFIGVSMLCFGTLTLLSLLP